MHTFATLFFILLATYWIVMDISVYRGMSRIPRLQDVAPYVSSRPPKISIAFAARDEAEKLPAALASLLALDYPNYEVVAVDDRSIDATGKILDEAAERDPRLKVVHVRELPKGWLGKPHALESAYCKSSGEWIVFTDADVRFAPDLLGQALGLAEKEHAEHLTLLAGLELRGFWEPTALGYLGLCFAMGVRPWKVSDAKSKVYMGVGAFQMIRRSAYEAIGTHKRLAMEVVDDMKLGKLVKEHGIRSAVTPSDDYLQIRWQEGIGNIIRGLTKNMFAGFEFSLWRMALAMLGILVISVAPFVGLFAATGAARIAAGVASGMAILFESRVMVQTQASRLFGFTHPLGALLVCYIMVRSAVVTLGRGGVVWRGTFYPLDELKRGIV